MFRLAVLAISVFVAGCAGPRYLDDLSEQFTNALVHWEIRGRISFREGSKGEIARINWQRKAENHSMEIYGGFGSRRIRIQQDSNGAVFENTEGEKIVGSSVQEVLLSKTGWNLPIEELMYWVVGLPYPEPGTDAITKNYNNGRVKSIHQSDWTVLLSRYREFDGYELPTRVRIIVKNPAVSILDSNQDEPNGETEIRLAITSWGIT